MWKPEENSVEPCRHSGGHCELQNLHISSIASTTDVSAVDRKPSFLPSVVSDSNWLLTHKVNLWVPVFVL